MAAIQRSACAGSQYQSVAAGGGCGLTIRRVCRCLPALMACIDALANTSGDVRGPGVMCGSMRAIAPWGTLAFRPGRPTTSSPGTTGTPWKTIRWPSFISMKMAARR
ncbi:Uncharacterised protein [Bordetella pertussis]|nr:Uncharacterised protein [Bordetella pertussis]